MNLINLIQSYTSKLDYLQASPENKNDNFSVKTMTFRQRLNMFEEKEKKENPMKNNTIKSDNKIVNKFKEGGEKSKEFLLKVQKVNENIKRKINLL